MITDDDIRKLKTVFATKADLKRFATKEDLKRFATKEDLKRFATKEDLKRFATKEDIRELKKVDMNLAKEVVGIRTEIIGIKENMATKDDFRQVMTTVDSVLGEVKAMREEQAAHFQQHDDNNWFHKEIDGRVKRIESVPAIAHEIKSR